jgi:hypothetical protein
MPASDVNRTWRHALMVLSGTDEIERLLPSPRRLSVRPWA